MPTMANAIQSWLAQAKPIPFMRKQPGLLPLRLISSTHPAEANPFEVGSAEADLVDAAIAEEGLININTVKTGETTTAPVEG